jgi:hypothetical protein
VGGIAVNPIPIAESIADFFSRIKMEKQFVKFTSPIDTPLWIKASAISLVRQPDPKEDPLPTVKSYVFIGAGAGSLMGIKEDVKTAGKAINEVRQKQIKRGIHRYRARQGSVALSRRIERKCAKSPIDFAGIFHLGLADFSPMQQCRWHLQSHQPQGRN